ncbi:MAG: thioredoxin domain-containing protein [Croceibacterium sp.]
MIVTKWLRAGLAALAVVAAAGASAQSSNRNWLGVVTLTDAGHRIGNPAAKLRLTEYISYTCPHCAAFAREGEGPLNLAYIGSGKLNLEIRHLIRDPVDLTAAVLAHCGPPAKFVQNHQAFMLGQDRWIGPLASASQSQRARWRVPGLAGRRAIANDFKFYDIMDRRGYSRVQTDKCLADEAMARKIATAADKDWKLPGVAGTPTFAINGLILAGTATWTALAPQLDARL